MCVANVYLIMKRKIIIAKIMKIIMKAISKRINNLILMASESKKKMAWKSCVIEAASKRNIMLVMKRIK